MHMARIYVHVACVSHEISRNAPLRRVFFAAFFEFLDLREQVFWSERLDSFLSHRLWSYIMTDIPVLFNTAEGISPIAVFSAENSDSKNFDFLDGSFSESSVCAELQDLWLIYNSPFRLYPPEEKPERYKNATLDKPTEKFLSEIWKCLIRPV